MDLIPYFLICPVQLHRFALTPPLESGGSSDHLIQRQTGVHVLSLRSPGILPRNEESNMEINCLGCGFKVELAAAYDDYEGPIKCLTCGAAMEIEAHGGSVQAVRSVMEAPVPSAELGLPAEPPRLPHRERHRVKRDA